MKEGEFAKLRLGMPMKALADVLGDDWEASEPSKSGRYFWFKGMSELDVAMPLANCKARVSADNTIGELGFIDGFPPALLIDGIYMGMPLHTLRALHPQLDRDPDGDYAEGKVEGYKCDLAGGDQLTARFKDEQLIGFDLVRPGLIYPGDEFRNYAPIPDAKAYEISTLPRAADRGATDNHGWCFGLPPGIKAAQWPLDKRTGHPMRHAFTLLLPEEYRCHGPELVAISLFDGDWNGERVDKSEAVAAIWDQLQSPPADPELLPVWQHRAGRHPHEHRMEDLLGEPSAVIWLTRAEFDGPLCQPPLQHNNTALRSALLPKWIAMGAAAAFVEREIGSTPEHPPEWYFVVRQIGGELPETTVDYHRALRWTPRANDPNAGVPPPEGDLFEAVSDKGYLSRWTDTFELLPWAKDFTERHIGGTMAPFQAHPTPPFSPFYIGFGEAMGGFNFGGGTAQLDLKTMRIDWACG